MAQAPDPLDRIKTTFQILAVAMEANTAAHKAREKHGSQVLPDGTGPGGEYLYDLAAYITEDDLQDADNAAFESAARQLCQDASRNGQDTWLKIAGEEFAELAGAEGEDVRKEALDLAAVLLNWVVDIDLRAAKTE